MNSKLLAAIMAATSLCACDGQVDSGYRGEPLMVLSGSVVASETPLSGELIPTFAFRLSTQVLARPEDPELDSPPEYKWYFLRGDVEGGFPNAFTMTLYDPPPADLLKPRFRGEPPLVIGAIGAVSPNHPRWLHQTGSYPTDGAGEPLGDYRKQICADDGQCLQSQDQCELGSPLPAADWPCGPKFPDQLPWETYGTSERHIVLYLAQAAAAGTYTARRFAGGSAIAAGYHLITTSPTRSQWQQQQWSAETEQCRSARARRIYEAFRMEVPAERAALDGIHTLDLELSDEIYERMELDEPCPNDVKMELADADQPLELTLSALPSEDVSF